jgi:hypothetical protein
LDIDGQPVAAKSDDPFRKSTTGVIKPLQTQGISLRDPVELEVQMSRIEPRLAITTRQGKTRKTRG